MALRQVLQGLRLSRPWFALDVACGSGRATSVLLESGANTVALDASPGMLAECRAHCATVSSAGCIEWVLGSAERLPFDDGIFDVVVSFRFLHLLPWTLYVPVIGEMMRVLKRGGRAVVEVKNANYGVVINHVRSLVRRMTGGSNGSTGATGRRLLEIGRSLPDTALVGIYGHTLPKAWWCLKREGLASLFRGLAGGPLHAVAGHLVGVYQKGR